jgi:hypothetical protein
LSLVVLLYVIDLYFLRIKWAQNIMKKANTITMFVIILAVILIVIYYSTDHTRMMGNGITGPYMTDGDHMMGEQVMVSDNFSKESPGTELFKAHCQRCHPNGGNIINPDIPLRGSHMLIEFDTFLNFIRSPRKHRGSKSLMPAFSPAIISNQQAMKLYQFVTTL